MVVPHEQGATSAFDDQGMNVIIHWFLMVYNKPATYAKMIQV